MASSFSITQPKVGMYTPPNTNHKSITTTPTSSSPKKPIIFDPLAPTNDSNTTMIQDSNMMQSMSTDRISSAFEGLSMEPQVQRGLPIESSSPDRILSAFEGLSTSDHGKDTILQSTSTRSTAFEGLSSSLSNDEIQPPQQTTLVAPVTSVSSIDRVSSDKISAAFENLEINNEPQQQQCQRSKSSDNLENSNLSSSENLTSSKLESLLSSTTTEQHHRSKSEVIRPNKEESNLSNELKHLSTELSSFFKEEKQKQQEKMRKQQEEERKEKFYKQVKKNFQAEGERQDRLSTLGLTPKASKKVAKEEKRRHDVLGISPKKIHKKMISLSMKNLQSVKDDRIATSAKCLPQNLRIEGPRSDSSVPPPPPVTPPLSPAAAKLTTPITPSNHTTSSEYEPSVHQIELSSVDEIYLTAKICTFMEDYRIVDQNFDLSSLLHIPHIAYTNVASNPIHKPIINSILDFGVEDIILQGFFILDGNDDCFHRMECVIFSSEVKRNFYVCFRGDCDQQKKPVRNREIRTGSSKAQVLHSTQTPTKIHPSFHESYYTRSNNQIEELVFSSIQQLVEANPFFDVVFTGYSFGAGLAMIASVRYSYLYSMMRVYCNVYSCPKVGCGSAEINWRDFVHTLSNLKIQRIEYGSDPYVNLPEGKWVHAGHSIQISKQNQPKAYKFDKFRPHPNSLELELRQRIKSKKQKHSDDYDVHVYLHALEKFSCRGLCWVKRFVGEDGKGVKGKNNEKRLLV